MDQLLLIFGIMAGGMGSPSYALRERATVSLSAYNKERDMNWLVGVYCNHPSLEVSRRSERIYNEYFFVRPHGYDYLPRIDTMDLQAEREYMSAWRTILCEDYCRYPPIWVWSRDDRNEDGQLRAATFLYVKNLFQSGHSRVTIVNRLNDMMANERIERFYEPQIQGFRPQGSMRGK